MDTVRVIEFSIYNGFKILQQNQIYPDEHEMSDTANRNEVPDGKCGAFRRVFILQSITAIFLIKKYLKES